MGALDLESELKKYHRKPSPQIEVIWRHTWLYMELAN